jgi:hypothetical protein
MKKLSSILVISLTVIYVTITLYLNEYKLVETSSIKIRQVISNIKNINIEKVLKLNNNQRVQYDPVKQSSPVEAKNYNQVSEFNVDVQHELTEEDKERLLLAANKLSPIDQVKINNYLENSENGGIKNAVSLLRDRLSDKDFEKIKNISDMLNKK